MNEGALGREYADGQMICRQGELGDRMYVVQSGCAEVVCEDGGTEIRIGELREGDVFGEMALCDNGPRSATIRASGTARILTLDKRTFMKQLHEDPSMAFRLLQNMSGRIRSLDKELALIRAASSKVHIVRNLFLVSRDRPELYEQLVRDFADDRDVQVVLDRRFGERRQRLQEHRPERRRADRRRSLDGWTIRLTETYRSGRPRSISQD